MISIPVSGRFGKIVSRLLPYCAARNGMHSKHAACICTGSHVHTTGVNGYRSGFISCHAEMDACMQFARMNGIYEVLSHFGDTKTQICTRRSDMRCENLLKVAKAEV
jgi:hypothetical protein